MNRKIYLVIKGFFDRILALLGLILLSPLLIVIALLLKLSSVEKVFFVHKRPGFKGKPFYLIKFKTMNDEKDENGNLLPNKERITKLGHFLRQTSLDEIPQLINVLKGELSLIGPRPLEMRYLSLYTDEQMRRHDVKPGISGWAQVNGRNTLSWEEKFKYDLWYVDHITLSLDLKILWLTLKKIIKREGINSSNKETVIPFDIHLKNKKNEI